MDSECRETAGDPALTFGRRRRRRTLDAEDVAPPTATSENAGPFGPALSGRRDSNSRRPPWQGGTLPLSYSRKRGGGVPPGEEAVKVRLPGRAEARLRRPPGSPRPGIRTLSC